MSLRDKLIAYLPCYASWASRVGGLLGAAQRLPGNHAAKRWLGLALERSVPSFKPSFLANQTPLATAPGASGQRQVLLFVDTFNNYMEPENARAAKRVLEAAGYTVHFNQRAGERPLCCGRTFLAAGLVDEAKAEARRLLDAVMPCVEHGVPIVGLEPSCLLSLRDEVLGYGFGDAARKVADNAFLFEEFLVREKSAGRFDVAWQALPDGVGEALVHGHCHQKAFDAYTPVTAVLGWVPGLKVSSIESSCCGMVGSFGYEAEHYDTSRAMSELTLLPAIRQRKENAIVVADGTSCRHQIHDGAGTQALHVACVLARALPA